MKKRIFSIFCVLCLCLTLLPTAALADGLETGTPTLLNGEGETDYATPSTEDGWTASGTIWKLYTSKHYDTPFYSDRSIVVYQGATLEAPDMKVDGTVEIDRGILSCSGTLQASELRVAETAGVGTLSCSQVTVKSSANLTVTTKWNCSGKVTVNENSTLYLPAGTEPNWDNFSGEGTVQIGDMAYDTAGTEQGTAVLILTSSASASGEGYTWDRDTCTLTLNGFARTYDTEAEGGIGIQAEGRAITLVLKGKNVMNGLDAAGITCVGSSLTLKGAGSLDCEGSAGALVIYGGSLALAEGYSLNEEADIFNETSGAGGTVIEAGTDETVPIPATSFTISDKQTLTITGVTAQGGTYNGQAQTGYTGTPSAGGYDGGFTVTYSTTDGKAPTNAGTYSVTIAIPEDNAQYVGSADLQFTIAPKALTVSAPSASVYVGDSAPELALTYTGLVAGESVTPSADPVFTITKSDDTEITLADAVKTAGTYTITWRNADGTTFTGDANYAIQTVTAGTLTVSTRSSGGGGGSSSSGGGSSSTTTEITKNPDGSTTTTVTNNTTGTVTETTKFPDGSKEVIETKKDGTVTTTTTDTTGNKTEVVENTDGSTETTVTNKDGSSSATTVDETGKTQAEVKLPAAVVEDAQGEAVTLPMPEVPITTDRETAPTVTVDLPSGTSAKVEIPVADVTPGTVAVIVKADGTEEVIKTSLTTENGVAVTLSDGDTVKIVNNSKTFDDVSATYWGAEAVDFTSSRELFAGTSATTFAPDTAMTRAMIVTVLARFEGVDTTTGDTWYEAGQQWAMQNGVSDGSNMDASLTREQLVTMFYRYAQSKGYDTTQGGMAIREYADFEQISDYAVEAMTWAVNTGIINGTSSTTLSPQGPATRAQVATILMRFIEGMA